MGIRLDKPWRLLSPSQVARVHGHLGVYQLGDDAGSVLYVGVAGGRSLFGLGGELQRELASPRAGVTRFRVEVSAQYRTRWQELLMLHRADHGELPRHNQGERLPKLGRLSPA
ncbi:MAG: hypothetical protein FJX55_16490 [Alphaproteobacteria bacterium]|nr:hypothetical protein [Alphaproteobacteria bacterium]